MSAALVIFGTTGDLARRKLLPALFTLHCKRLLPDDLRIVGFARGKLTHAGYCANLWAEMGGYADLTCRSDVWPSFAERVTFVQGDLSRAEDVARLERTLAEAERGQREANRLYYLSIAPQLYAPAIRSLRANGMHEERGGWRRVVVEKPFGRDGASAAELDAALHAAFDEERVYRIDHYLGKETVQNLLVLRFANAIFEPVWNRAHVDNVQITVAEEVDVGTRAGYYDASGALRDMAQNHLLQLLTLVAMEPPASMAADDLHREKARTLAAVRRWRTPQDAAAHAVAGQYDGYLEAEGVAADSKTPTFAALRLYVDTPRWEGVPFHLRTGKAMAAKSTEVAVQFRAPPRSLVNFGGGEPQANRLGLCIQPHEGVHLRFQVKTPGPSAEASSRDLEFHYARAFPNQSIPEAYERLLQDALSGDRALFIPAEQIREAWEVVDPLLAAWEAPDAPRPRPYPRGSWGPDAAEALIAETGHGWLATCGEHG